MYPPNLMPLVSWSRAVAPGNPLGVAESVYTRGWKDCFEHGFGTEPSLRRYVEDFGHVGICLMWPMGRAAVPYSVGSYALAQGDKITCAVRGLHEHAVVEKHAPGLWPALAPHIAGVHERGGRVAVYVGGLPEDLFDGLGARSRTMRLRWMLAPLLNAGIGKGDVLFLDAVGETRQDIWRTPSMRLLDYARGLGVEPGVEPHGKIARGTAEYLSMHLMSLRVGPESASRWDTAARNADGTWISPANRHVGAAHWCVVQGSTPPAERLPLATGSGADYIVVEMAGLVERRA